MELMMVGSSNNNDTTNVEGQLFDEVKRQATNCIIRLLENVKRESSFVFQEATPLNALRILLLLIAVMRRQQRIVLLAVIGLLAACEFYQLYNYDNNTNKENIINNKQHHGDDNAIIDLLP